MSLSAEALMEGEEKRAAAIVFGPENGAVAEMPAFEAAREAYAKRYCHLYATGFAIQPDARRLIEQAGNGDHHVELLGPDMFDPVDMDSGHREGADVPTWFPDTDYNGLCLHVCRAFFPKTSAWEGLKRSPHGEFDENVWPHLSGTISAPFRVGAYGRISVKAMDDRGGELMVVNPLSEAETEA